MMTPIAFELSSRRARFRRLLAVGSLLPLLALDVTGARVSAAAPDPQTLQAEYDAAMQAGEDALTKRDLAGAERAFLRAVDCNTREAALLAALDPSQKWLVVIYGQEGRLDAVEREQRARLAALEKEHGPLDPSLAPALGMLALIADARGDYDDSLKRLERLVTIARAAHWDNFGHVHVIIAFLRFAKGDRAGGLSARQDALRETLAMRLPADPFHDAMWDADWGWLEVANGKWQHARKIFAAAIDQLTKLVGPSHPYVASLWEAQADVLAHLHRRGEAEAARARAAAIWRKVRPAKLPD
jgi:tetratricopeptide (TPR) repeat protein